jgi:filamentous hemagglutinin
VGNVAGDAVKVASDADKVVDAVKATKGTTSAILFEEMIAKGIKFTPENVIQASKLPDGKIVFLESGNSTAGLQHILDRHAVDFTNKGISTAEIPSVVMRAVTEGKMVGTNGSAPVYEIVHNGVTQHISVGVASNGFIVRANPVSTWKPL